MDSLRSVLERVASAKTVEIRDAFYRHAAPNRDAFTGGTDDRWGANFRVIYLARPESGTVIEAYRHLVEDQGIPAANIRPRILYTVPVKVTRVLDLTDDKTAATVGLTTADLHSTVGEYDACQAVAAAAHQLNRHGILAPAAEGAGATLALFTERLSIDERPVPTAQTLWASLPSDPRQQRHLRAVRDGDAS
ncbi:biotin acetyl-CoA-carboxylase synthetase [Leifsonia xyli subsp. cynodontis DSM 46306]|uniref:RES domain-containing protein n=1 Tax=Leifsonia xyli subsp. cynodontis DSM 46306 TaxID=1389489 RepID=U3P6L1_LEIXC|nr:RES domain-containing protein [Leifsonia xyli]AGW41426.1 biotin acetyl-CoA-carboxylase synthetase [Leifsonia xyli subsp. cynodontis DSM 46306]